MSTLAERLADEIELREAARRLLSLEAGELARAASPENLSVAVDYLWTLVQEVTR